jgi:uncharacterized protein
MSYAIDVNLLLYASDRDAPRHDAALKFLEEATQRDELVGVPYPVILGYLRIATHPRVFRQPLTPAEALQNVESLAALPHVRLLAEHDGFIEEYRAVTSTIAARGNLVPDAHIATILRQHDIRVFYE